MWNFCVMSPTASKEADAHYWCSWGNVWENPISTLGLLSGDLKWHPQNLPSKSLGSACSPPGLSSAQRGPVINTPHPEGTSQFLQWELPQHPTSCCTEFEIRLQSLHQGTWQESCLELCPDLPEYQKETPAQPLPALEKSMQIPNLQPPHQGPLVKPFQACNVPKLWPILHVPDHPSGWSSWEKMEVSGTIGSLQIPYSLLLRSPPLLLRALPCIWLFSHVSSLVFYEIIMLTQGVLILITFIWSLLSVLLWCVNSELWPKAFPHMELTCSSSSVWILLWLLSPELWLKAFPYWWHSKCFSQGSILSVFSKGIYLIESFLTLGTVILFLSYLMLSKERTLTEGFPTITTLIRLLSSGH